jgi:hypothetical protein
MCITRARAPLPANGGLLGRTGYDRHQSKIYPSLSPGVAAFNGKAFEQGGERSANGMDRLLPRRLGARNRLGAGTFAGPHGCLAHSRTEVIASKWRQAAPAFAQIGIVVGTIVRAG